MSRATFDVFHPQVPGAGSDRYAVISGPDGATGDGDAGRALDMDSVCVGALVRGDDLHIPNSYILATIDHQVAQLAVDWR